MFFKYPGTYRTTVTTLHNVLLQFQKFASLWDAKHSGRCALIPWCRKLSPNQTIVTFQGKHCLERHTTCGALYLATLLGRVVARPLSADILKFSLAARPRGQKQSKMNDHVYWLKFDHFQAWANNTQHVAIGWPNARNMLRWNVAIVWSGL